MSSALGGRERLKRALIELLEKDVECRYTVMGLVGFREVLDRIVGLEERFAQLEERQQRLEERQQRLEERLLRVEEELRETRRVLNTIAHRFGVLTETGFREAMKHVLAEILGVAEVEKLTLRDEEGMVYGYPSEIDVDIVVKNKEHILVEVKSRVDAGDVAILARKASLYEKETGIKPKAIILGGYITSRAYETGARLGVRVVPYLKESWP